MPRRLVMMWDYSSDGLWEADTGYGLSLDDLPLSDTTRAGVRDWIARIDAANFAAWESDDVDEGLDPEETRAADALGRALWLDVRRELGGDYDVGYAVRDGEALAVIWSPGGEPAPLPWPREREG